MKTDEELFREWALEYSRQNKCIMSPKEIQRVSSAFLTALELGRQQEREECAKLVEQTETCMCCSETEIAAAIRERGK